jgi:hypothetical protein
MKKKLIASLLFLLSSTVPAEADDNIQMMYAGEMAAWVQAPSPWKRIPASEEEGRDNQILAKYSLPSASWKVVQMYVSIIPASMNKPDTLDTTLKKSTKLNQARGKILVRTQKKKTSGGIEYGLQHWTISGINSFVGLSVNKDGTFLLVGNSFAKKYDKEVESAVSEIMSKVVFPSRVLLDVPKKLH